MAARGVLAHDQYPADICTPASHFGENLGLSSNEPRTAVLVLEETMMAEGPCPVPGCPGSQEEAHGHYENLLDPRFRRVGIGIVARNGSTWLTEDFTG
jgi:hypothetical protein